MSRFGRTCGDDKNTSEDLASSATILRRGTCQSSDGSREAYEISGTEDADVVALETIYAALQREPQVALTLRLVKTFPTAVFLPAKISIDLQLLDIQLESTAFPPQPKNRLSLGRVFDLDPDTSLNLEIDNDHLPAAKLTIPERIEPNQYPFLTTSASVFDRVVITDYDAEITVPVAVEGVDQSWLGHEIQFRYRVNESPGFDWTFLQPSSS
jgi:hypothetical protein